MTRSLQLAAVLVVLAVEIGLLVGVSGETMAQPAQFVSVSGETMVQPAQPNAWTA